MASYVLVPGAGGNAWYWHRVTPRLRALGHDVVAVDLPAADEGAGLYDYVDVIDAVVAPRRDVVLVAQSMGGLSASAVCGQASVDLLVLVAPMIPAPGETGGDWWVNTGQPQAAAALAHQEGRSVDDEIDAEEIFLHDLPSDVRAEAMRQPFEQSGRPFGDPWPLREWPEVETRVVAATRDRLFPLEFMRDLSRKRLGVDPDEIESGHLVALSRPDDLVEMLEGYRTELGIG